MKNLKHTIVLIIVLLLQQISSAQSPVYDITDYHHFAQEIPGAYYKDINNQLNPYEGTYVYNDGSLYLKIILRKVTMSSIAGYYEDLLIGEYQVKINNIEKVNTLNEINNDYSCQVNHHISANSIFDGTYLCTECSATDMHVNGSLNDRITHNGAAIDFRLITSNGQPALRLLVMWDMRAHLPGQPALLDASFSGGYYTLIKQ